MQQPCFLICSSLPPPRPDLCRVGRKLTFSSKGNMSVLAKPWTLISILIPAALWQEQTHFFVSCRERQIKCPKCDKLFLRTNHLKKHLNSHEGKRDYVCEKCSKAYLTKYHLTRHLKICKGPTSSLSAPEEEEEEDSEEELIDSMRTEDGRINNGVYSTGDTLSGHK